MNRRKDDERGAVDFGRVLILESVLRHNPNLSLDNLRGKEMSELLALIPNVNDNDIDSFLREILSSDSHLNQGFDGNLPHRRMAPSNHRY